MGTLKGGAVLRSDSLSVSKPRKDGFGVGPLTIPETHGTQKPSFWLIPHIFPNEIFGDLLYKLSSVITVNRYIARNATGPDESSS